MKSKRQVMFSFDQLLYLMMSRNVGRRIDKKKQKQMMVILMTLVILEIIRTSLPEGTPKNNLMMRRAGLF